MSNTLTREQLERRKERAVRFVRDVLGDPDRADEIEDESLEDYAERRKITIVNPRRERMASKEELEERIRELEEENDNLQDQLDQIADIAAPIEDEGKEGEGNNNRDRPTVGNPRRRSLTERPGFARRNARR